MKLMEALDQNSIAQLKVWCFGEALRTRDSDALKLWLQEWDKSEVAS